MAEDEERPPRRLGLPYAAPEQQSLEPERGPGQRTGRQQDQQRAGAAPIHPGVTDPPDEDPGSVGAACQCRAPAVIFHTVPFVFHHPGS